LTNAAEVHHRSIDVHLAGESSKELELLVGVAEIMAYHQVGLPRFKNDAARLAQRQQSPKDQEPATQKTHQSMIAVTIWIS
jgi:hypothetical protein